LSESIIFGVNVVLMDT